MERTPTSSRDHRPEPAREAPPRQTLRVRLLAIDQRSLSAFRIAIGLLLLVDLGIRATDIGAMYSDDGMFSRARICRHYTSFWNWSFHFGGGSWSYQAALFGLAAFFALAMVVGFRTRLATVASWLLLVSLHNRVPPILSGADNLLRVLLFWGMFLPLGGIWSLDVRLSRRNGIEPSGIHRVLSLASAAILIQVALVYVVSAAFKSNAHWARGNAIAASLEYSFFGRPMASGLLAYPVVLSALTVSVLVLEWSGVFLFSPWWTGRVRLLVVALLACMHVGIALLMSVGLFPFVSLAGLILFLPSSFWQKAPGHRGLSSSAPSPSAFREEIVAGPAPPGIVYAARGVCALALLIVLLENLNGLQGRSVPSRSGWNDFARIALGLGQKWDMFANPPPRDGWYVARAILANGKEVDLLRSGEPVTWERPEHPAAVYPDQHWLKIFREMTYTDQGYQVFREPVCEYLCLVWNRSHPADERISDFALVFCLEGEAGLDGGPRSAAGVMMMVHLEFAPPAG